MMGLLSIDDVAGAEDYLADVERRDGWQMAKNVTDMISLTLGIPPPELR